MVKPGVYRHYKSTPTGLKLYRVLFSAIYVTRDSPKPNEALMVFSARGGVWITLAKDYQQIGAQSPLFTVYWSGNEGADVSYDTPIVVYVAIYGEGRIAARTVEEFKELVRVEPYVKRFEWVTP